MEWLDIASKVGVPLLGLFAGWIGAALQIRTKLATIEQTAARAKDDIEKVATRVKEEEAQYREQTKQGLIRDFAELRRALAAQFDHLKEAFGEHTSRIDQLRESSHDHAEKAALAIFIAESNDRWEQTVRTLGILEGMLGKALPQRNLPPRR